MSVASIYLVLAFIRRITEDTLSYVATDPGSYAGQVVGDGQCVAYVKVAASAPVTSRWAQGATVKGNNISTGTAIATFQDGKYQNDTGGKSHAAIYISQDSNGLLVWDQWVHQPVHKRTIMFADGSKPPRNDGDAFSVIETATLLQWMRNLILSIFRLS
jgi:hypothetical protein